MVKGGHSRPSGSGCDNNNLKKWCDLVKQVSVRSRSDKIQTITVAGGSDNGEFIHVTEIDDHIEYVDDAVFEIGDVILIAQDQKVSGFTYLDAVHLLEYCWENNELLTFECVPRGLIPLSLAVYLSHRFQKGSLEHELQNTIRDNLYVRTVPVTTRKPRELEINGVDYLFLSVDEFFKLKLEGALLESGIYEENYYGTPKPLNNSFLSAVNQKTSGESLLRLPGSHPCSEGKRKRNRSNVEAMAAKDLSHGQLNSTQNSMKNDYNVNEKKNPPNYYYDSNMKYADQLEEDELGPLPSKWEKAFTKNGEVYFIDHNSSTSHWLDPRLSRIQKKSLEDCSEDELPYGWERIDDPIYGTYYIDHVNRQTQYENPVVQAKYKGNSSANNCDKTTNNCSKSLENIDLNDNFDHENSYGCYLNNNKFSDGVTENTFFTTNPAELVGERIHSTLVKSYKGLGFTIVGGDDSKEEFLQIKSIVTNGPAWFEGKLQTGDVLVHVNNKCVLGYTHNDMVSVFQSIAPGEIVELEVCRGYPLAFDPNDPNNEVVTTVAVGSNENVHLNSFIVRDVYLKKHHIIDSESNDISNSSVKSMPDLYLPERLQIPRPTSTDLMLQDDKPEYLTVSIVKGAMGFGFTIADSAYGQKVKKILDKPRCQTLAEGDVLIGINNINVRRMCHSDVVQILKDCASNKAATITVERLHFVNNKLLNKDEPNSNLYRSKTPTDSIILDASQNPSKSADHSTNNLNRNVDMYSIDNGNMPPSCYSRSQSPRNELDQNDEYWNGKRSPELYKHNDNVYSPAVQNSYYNAKEYNGCENDLQNNYFYPVTNGTSKESTSFEHEQPATASNESRMYKKKHDDEYCEMVVSLERQEAGFGFRIVGGTEEGSQVSIGHIVEGGAAEVDGRLRSGDEIVSVDNKSVMNCSHRHIVQLMGKAAANGKVTLGIRRMIAFKNHNTPQLLSELRYPYDVTVNRRENEGFGFVIISSLNKVGSTIGRIIEGSPAERCGLLHIGDYILAVNGISIMNLPHGDIVNLIKDSGYNVTLTIGMPLDNASSAFSITTSHREEELYEGQYHAIEISRGCRGFGFSIRGGREFQNMALFVLQIAENGPAALDGRLKVGDRLIEINGINTKNMTHSQAIEIIRNGGPAVRLLVQRGVKIPPAAFDERFVSSPTQHLGVMMCSPSDPRSGLPGSRADIWDNHNNVSTGELQQRKPTLMIGREM